MKVARWEACRFLKSGPAGKRATFFCVYKGRWASVCTKENNIYSIKCGYK